jgi:hypothetical protein
VHSIGRGLERVRFADRSLRLTADQFREFVGAIRLDLHRVRRSIETGRKPSIKRFEPVQDLVKRRRSDGSAMK